VNAPIIFQMVSVTHLAILGPTIILQE